MLLFEKLAILHLGGKFLVMGELQGCEKMPGAAPMFSPLMVPEETCC